MTDCPDGLMRDLLPEYALGVLAAEDAARVAAHVAECEACQDELALLGAVRAEAERDVPAIDIAAIVRALPAPVVAVPTSRPAAAKARQRWFSVGTWQYAAAAGLALAVIGGVWYRGASVTTLAQVADSSTVRVAAETTVAPKGVDEGITFGGGLSDLSLNDLQKLMGQMDSVKTLPSVDPESVTPVIALTEGGKGL